MKEIKRVHGEKLLAAIESEKMPTIDVPRLKEAFSVYEKWSNAIYSIDAENFRDFLIAMVNKLNEYKFYIDVNIIFDSPEDFLYRQKGQLKLDNTILEEFLPVFVRRCVEKKIGDIDLLIEAQSAIFSSVYFASSISTPGIGGGISIKTKDQDFSMSRPLYLMSSYDPNFATANTTKLKTYLGYVLAELKTNLESNFSEYEQKETNLAFLACECKTNLDKTMFQEASATAHDVKQAVTGAKYYLLCDFLDMTPISTTTTDIDEILILRKAKRINSSIRKNYATYKGRQSGRNEFIDYLKAHPYQPDIFNRFIDHVVSQIQNEDLVEKSILEMGYF